MEIFPPQSRHPLHQSLWSPHFLWNDSPLLQQTSTMSCSWDSLYLSSCALPGTYLPSLLPQSLSFSVNVFSSSVLCHACTLVTSSLSLNLKIHTWLSLCLLSPLHMVLSSQSHVTSISLRHSSRFPGHVKSATHISLPCYPATNMDDTVLSPSMTQPDYTAYQLLTNFLPVSYQALSHLCLQGHSLSCI